MIFQTLMGLGKSKCDVPGGTTQGWACPRAIGITSLAFVQIW